MAYNLKNRHFLTLRDYSPRGIALLLKLSADLKTAKCNGTERKTLQGKDIALIFEKDSTRTRVAFAFLGDAGNNMGDSLLIGGAKMGMDVRLCAPKACWPDQGVRNEADAIAEETGARILITEDVDVAVKGVDFVYTDVWVSMGEAKEKWAERIKLLMPFQVNAAVMAQTRNPRASFMHCLPVFHNTETVVGAEIQAEFGIDAVEVTEVVFESAASVVFDQAENRMHTIKAVLVATLGA